MGLEKVIHDWVGGHFAFRNLGPTVTAFGSARVKEDHPYYVLCREVCKEVAKAGYTVMTGGGPGLMEAANRGAQEGGGLSAGCNVIMPGEVTPNDYIDKLFIAKRMFTRKVHLVKHAQAFLVFPGGQGTLDELFETHVLVRKQMHPDSPIVLIGTEYWTPLLDWLKNTVAREGILSADEIDFMHLVNSPEEVLSLLPKLS